MWRLFLRLEALALGLVTRRKTSRCLRQQRMTRRRVPMLLRLRSLQFNASCLRYDIYLHLVSTASPGLKRQVPACATSALEAFAGPELVNRLKFVARRSGTSISNEELCRSNLTLLVPLGAGFAPVSAWDRRKRAFRSTFRARRAGLKLARIEAPPASQNAVRCQEIVP